jgi:hypothetical protein
MTDRDPDVSAEDELRSLRDQLVPATLPLSDEAGPPPGRTGLTLPGCQRRTPQTAGSVASAGSDSSRSLLPEEKS